MLTLQNVLDSDSISTLVGKLNANFQTIAMSNGGPQGVRGEQGIPGLPGKQGSTGPSGPAGATGPGMGLIPFSQLTQPTVTIGGVGQPQLSLDFLLNASDQWGPGPAPVHGQMWFDNNQLGWWKYLTYPDPTTTDPEAPDLETFPYDLAGYTGPGWYFYPLNFSSIVALTQGVWNSDKTNYLGLVNPAYASPAVITDPITQEPFSIPNARFNSKFGAVWISSFDGTTPVDDDNTKNTTDILYNWDYTDSTRLNSGVDRLLFKMSIDGPRFYDNMKARAFRAPTDDGLAIIGLPWRVNGGTIDVPDAAAPTANNAGNNQTYFVQPLYTATIDAYAPILYYTNRNDDRDTGNNNGSLGYYQYSPTVGGIRIHNFSTRNANEFYVGALTSSTNVGEMLFDVRRFITSNQYLNSFPQDTAGYTSIDEVLTPQIISPYTVSTSNYYEEWGATNPWKVFQGYHSMFTGQKVVNAAASGNQSMIADVYTWIYNNRQSWYGTSIYESGPNPDTDAANTELIRSAGFMARGMNGTYTSGVTNYNGYIDGVLVYTANLTGTGPSSDPSYDTLPIDSATGALLSLPVAYFSPTRNVGIGTMSMDKVGIFEPSARVHSHADWRPELEAYNTITNYDTTISTGSYTGIDKTWFLYSNVPKRRLKSAAFTVERENPALIYGAGLGGAFSATRFATGPTYFDDWNTLGIFNDLLLGAIDAPYNEVTKLGYTSAAKASAGIRYESFNQINTGPRIDHSDVNSNKGWAFRGALRLGSSPIFTSGNATRPDGYEIGSDANYQNVDYQLHISPLSFSNATDATLPNKAISGVGIHNIYPRSRFHLYGKNIYQEFRGDEAVTPGYVEPLLTVSTPTTPSSWKNYPSNLQISIDQIRDTFVYNAAIFDYGYDYLVLSPFITVAGGQYSNNSRNYPTRDSKGSNAPTISTWNSTLNISELGANPSGSNLGKSALHGGYWNAYWNLDKYIGFNMFRDLLAKGDNRGEAPKASNYANPNYVNDISASVWRVGTDSTTKDGHLTNDLPPSNGGSAIISDSDGRLGFAFMPKWRDGGVNYAQWEQQGIGTREVINNVKIIFDESGNIGIGNAPGLDTDAYPSVNWNMTNGLVNYLPNANGGIADPTIDNPTFYSNVPPYTPWDPTANSRYGLSYVNAYGSTGPTYNAAVNAKATISENIRFEVGAEKAQGRPGHHVEKRGYGYPGFLMDTAGKPTGTGGVITITDNPQNTFAHRYLGVTLNTALWNAGCVYTLRTDNLGRLMAFEITCPGGNPIGTSNLLDLYPTSKLPHPTDFAPGGPFDPDTFPNIAVYPWTQTLSLSITINGTAVPNTQSIWIPTSAVAGALASAFFRPVFGGGSKISGDFVYEEFKKSVVRLNNFTLGDGYEFIRSNGDSTDVTSVNELGNGAKKIFDARTSSPKLLLTYAGIDYAGMDAAGIPLSTLNLLITQGQAPVMKVTSIIESAQNETSVRTYTIPKADNTGGTFMVITDHMGRTQKNQPGLTPLRTGFEGLNNKFRIERITTYEVQRTFNYYRLQRSGYITFDNQQDLNSANFAYEMTNIQYWDNGYLPHTRGVEGMYYPLPLTTFSSTNTPTVGTDLVTEMQRNTDSYWKINEDVYASRWWTDPNDIKTNKTSTQESFEKSEVRYSRLNENYLLFDFNISIDPLDYVNKGGIGSQQNGFFFGNELSSGGTLSGYSHSPFAAGYYSRQYNGDDDSFWNGIDARWIQYIRIAYDIGADVEFTDGSIVNDPNFYENEYGGGANFNNWNDFRAWYPGTAIVGPNINVETRNFIDNSVKGWVPTTDGSPYNNFGLPTDLRVATPSMYWQSKTFNGRFTDWYWSTYNTETFDALAAWAALPRSASEIAANPWAALNFGGTGDAAGWFKTSKINQYGYSKLQRGWWQAVGAPDGAGSVGFANPDAMIPISIPQYFDALVWRSFGDDAWNRNGNFQWRVTPYYNDPGSGSASIPYSAKFNTFVIEIMFDKPIYVSGAKRRISIGSTDYNDNAEIPSYGSVPEMYSPVDDIIGPFPSDQVSCTLASRAQGTYFLGTADNGTVYKPYGTIELRGQSMIKYKKTFNTIDTGGGGGGGGGGAPAPGPGGG